MLYGDFFLNYKNLISYFLVVFNNYCMNNNMDTTSGVDKIEKAYNIIETGSVSTSYHINHVNTIFKDFRPKIMECITSGAVFNLSDVNKLDLVVKPDGKLNISVKKLYDMCTFMDHNKSVLGETPVYVDKFNYYFLRLLSGCTMADDIKPQMDTKITELGVKTGILKVESGGGPVIFDIFKSIASGDFKNKVNSVINEENIETVRDISKNILGENDLVNSVIDKVKCNISNPITAITEVFNDEQIMDKAGNMIKSIGENPKFQSTKIQINNITNAITNKIDGIDNDLQLVESRLEDL